MVGVQYWSYHESNRVSQGMGQIIDIDQRRKPGPAYGMAAEAALSARPGLPSAQFEQMLLPALAVWRSWMATWATLWLAPMGLHVRPVELPATTPARDRANLRS
jgi:hypothetical protein